MFMMTRAYHTRHGRCSTVGMNTTKIETAGDKAMQHAAMLALVSADGGVCYRTLNTRVGELRSLTVHEVRFDSFQALAA